jgi:two-component system, NarL family, invasion response regulator UvrY
LRIHFTSRMKNGICSVLIVDDQNLAWEKLCEIISGETDLSVLQIVKDVQEVIGVLSTRHPDVIILSVAIPNQSTLSIIRFLHKVHVKIKILLAVKYLDMHFALRAYKAGISGYLPKSIAPEEYIKAIRKVQSGGKYVIPWLAGKIVEELNSPTEPPPHEDLSDREFLVMCFIAAGKTAQEIADILKITLKTVSGYRSRIFFKMKMKTASELKSYVNDNLLYE